MIFDNNMESIALIISEDMTNCDALLFSIFHSINFESEYFSQSR